MCPLSWANVLAGRPAGDTMKRPPEKAKANGKLSADGKPPILVVVVVGHKDRISPVRVISLTLSVVELANIVIEKPSFEISDSPQKIANPMVILLRSPADRLVTGGDGIVSVLEIVDEIERMDGLDVGVVRRVEFGECVLPPLQPFDDPILRRLNQIRTAGTGGPSLAVDHDIAA